MTNESPTPVPTSYTDDAGRAWDLKVDLPTADRLHSQVDLDLDSLIGGTAIRELGTQQRRVLHIAWCILGPQALSAGVSQEAWCDALGECMGEAVEATIGGLIAFFRQRELRDYLTTVYRTLPQTASHLSQALQTLTDQGGEMIQQASETDTLASLTGINETATRPDGSAGNSPDS